MRRPRSSSKCAETGRGNGASLLSQCAIIKWKLLIFQHYLLNRLRSSSGGGGARGERRHAVRIAEHDRRRRRRRRRGPPNTVRTTERAHKDAYVHTGANTPRAHTAGDGAVQSGAAACRPIGLCDIIMRAPSRVRSASERGKIRRA